MGYSKIYAAAFAVATIVVKVEATYWDLPSCTSAFQPFVYSGCFQDNATANALSFRANTNFDTMTVETCVAECKGNGYRYAGLEYYGQCFCGQTVNGAQLAESQCNFPCKGNSSQTCGASRKLSVYQDPTFNNVDLSAGISDYVPLGCYTDNAANPRTLGTLLKTIPTTALTTESCLQGCKAIGFPFAGTEYGGECWCGVVLGNNTKIAPDTECNKPCNGNTSQTCGGSSRLSMYVAQDLLSIEPCGFQSPVVSSSVVSSAVSTVAPVSTVVSSSTSDVASSSTDIAVSSTSDVASSSTDFAVSSTSDVASSSTDIAVSSAWSTSYSSDFSTSWATSWSTAWSSSWSTSEVASTSTLVSTSTSTSEAVSTSTVADVSSTSDVASTSPVASSSSSSTSDAASTSAVVSTSTAVASSTTSDVISSTSSVVIVITSTSAVLPTTASTSTTLAAVTTTKANVCTTTTVVPPTCEYKCGNWCSSPLPDFDDETSCTSSHASCHIQIAACFKSAGWPGAMTCFDFSAWCGTVSEYCKAKPRSKSDCVARNPPKGGDKSVTSTITVPCKTTTTAAAPTTTSTKCPIPTPTGICVQPSNRQWGYGPGNAVGGIDLAVVTCNDLKDDFVRNPFKLYTDKDSSRCSSFPRNNVPSACSQACKVQYEQCSATYVQGCQENQSWGKNWGANIVAAIADNKNTSSIWSWVTNLFGIGKREASYFEYKAAASQPQKRTFRWTDSASTASNKCQAQYNDCLDVNKRSNGAGKCSSWGVGW